MIAHTNTYIQKVSLLVYAILRCTAALKLISPIETLGPIGDTGPVKVSTFP